MEYISHSDYTNMLKNFGKETPKGILKEAIEKEGNAFTAALAKTPKGGDLKVGGKVVGRDKTSYDAPVKENDDALQGVLDNMATRLKGQSLPYEKLEQIADALQKQGHEVNARYLQDFLKKHGVSVQEGTESAEYPGSWGMREGGEAMHDRATAVAERLKAQGMDEESVYIYLVDDMNLSSATAQAVCDSVFGTKEGLDLTNPDMQATGPTIQTTEGSGYNFSVLQPDEVQQLKEYINSIKTIKQEIAKLLEKAKPGAAMESHMGGDRTNLVMPTEADDDKMSDEEAEAMVAKHEKEKKDKEDYEASIH